jgi:RHS repeat-associated protein
VAAVQALGFTRRQARFVMLVLEHPGVCLPRQYRAFAGIPHGRQTHGFFDKLITGGFALRLALAGVLLAPFGYAQGAPSHVEGLNTKSQWPEHGHLLGPGGLRDDGPVGTGARRTDLPPPVQALVPAVGRARPPAPQARECGARGRSSDCATGTALRAGRSMVLDDVVAQPVTCRRVRAAVGGRIRRRMAAPFARLVVALALTLGAALPLPAAAAVVRLTISQETVHSPVPDRGAGPANARSYFGARSLRASAWRFTTVDPAMTLKENLEDPQRWNRYGYVRNNPLRLVDRNGLWIEDVHRDLTTALAYAAGFTWSDAKAIGAADQATDDDPRTQPMDYANASHYHCTNAADRVALWAEAERSGSLEDFGHALHATQDSFIHPPLVLWSALDHAKDRTFDQTYQHPTEALRMAERTFNILAAKAPNAAGPVDFDAIRPMVKAWVAEKDLKKKAKILDDMLSLVDERSVSIKK